MYNYIEYYIKIPDKNEATQAYICLLSLRPSRINFSFLKL